jgi:hypothetical protein
MSACKLEPLPEINTANRFIIIIITGSMSSIRQAQDRFRGRRLTRSVPLERQQKEYLLVKVCFFDLPYFG